MARPDQILKFVHAVHHPNLRVCLDTGHCMVLGIAPEDAVKQIGKEHLWAIHVHDNDGIRDLHLSPFDGICDWNRFGKALREIDFDGVFSLEAAVPISCQEKERFIGIRELYQRAVKIIAQE